MLASKNQYYLEDWEHQTHIFFSVRFSPQNPHKGLDFYVSVVFWFWQTTSEWLKKYQRRGIPLMNSRFTMIYTEKTGTCWKVTHISYGTLSITFNDTAVAGQQDTIKTGVKICLPHAKMNAELQNKTTTPAGRNFCVRWVRRTTKHTPIEMQSPKRSRMTPRKTIDPRKTPAGIGWIFDWNNHFRS